MITNRDGKDATVPHKVIADHIRSISFLVADGVLPSNEGRGYVLRRIIRRALRYGHSLGFMEPFLYKLVPVVGKFMGSAYPELLDSDRVTAGILQSEEVGFMNTLDKGMQILRSEIDRMGSAREFSAEMAYRLYDTYGFPFDMTRDVLRGAGKVVDESAFDAIVTERKIATKGTFCGGSAVGTENIWYDVEETVNKAGGAVFRRGIRSCRAKVLALVHDGSLVDAAPAGSEVFVVVSETPFYAESGGQAGDCGTINCLNGSSRATVSDTVRKIGGVIVHSGVITHGKLSRNDEVEMTVDWGRRLRISRNHTATHLLHIALKNVLGDHVRQKGSSVTADRLRFDFIHHAAISSSQQSEIEEIVRKIIDEDFELNTRELPIEEARKTGAIALFGERYPEIVRVVTICDSVSGSVFSREICGGEHVKTTSQIGCFKILAVSSVGSGVRRIEAVTGPGLFEYLDAQVSEGRARIDSQAAILKKHEKELTDLRTTNALGSVEIQEERVGEVVFRWALLEMADKRLILGLIDREKVASGKRCLLIGQRDDRTGKVAMSLFISKELAATGIDARDILRRALSAETGQSEGRVGGRIDLAQTGGLLPVSKFDDYLVKIHDDFYRSVALGN
jgi:alanyl-tRNA synthetase